MHRLPFLTLLFATALATTLTACRTPQRYIQATVSNRSGHPLHTLEFDYPSASFGTQTLEDGADFHYRFLVQGPATPAKFSFLDPASPTPHAVTSTFTLTPGDEGSLTLTISAADEVTWTNAITHPAR